MTDIEQFLAHLGSNESNGRRGRKTYYVPGMAARIQEFRRAKGLTLAELAKRSRISESYLSQILCEFRSGRRSAALIAKALGCSEGYLLGDIRAPKEATGCDSKTHNNTPLPSTEQPATSNCGASAEIASPM